jgi:hypothetical protein
MAGWRNQESCWSREWEERKASTHTMYILVAIGVDSESRMLGLSWRLACRGRRLELVGEKWPDAVEEIGETSLAAWVLGLGRRVYGRESSREREWSRVKTATNALGVPCTCLRPRYVQCTCVFLLVWYFWIVQIIGFRARVTRIPIFSKFQNNILIF